MPDEVKPVVASNPAPVASNPAPVASNPAPVATNPVVTKVIQLDRPNPKFVSSRQIIFTNGEAIEVSIQQRDIAIDTPITVNDLDVSGGIVATKIYGKDS